GQGFGPKGRSLAWERSPVLEPQTISEGLRPLPDGFRHDPPHTSPLHAAVERSRSCLLGRQHADGHWCGELQGDTILESEFVLLMAFLGREKDPRVVKAARYILRH